MTYGQREMAAPIPRMTDRERSALVALGKFHYHESTARAVANVCGWTVARAAAVLRSCTRKGFADALYTAADATTYQVTPFGCAVYSSTRGR
jgi:hypothetical protein